MSAPELSVGLVLLPEHQWLDAAGTTDYLYNHSYDILSKLYTDNPELVSKAPRMTFHYISSDYSPVHASSGPPQTPTCTYENCPFVDIIIVPGADPAAEAPKGFVEFIQTRYADPKFKAILMVCTGSMCIARTGILDGHQVCSNKFVLRMAANNKMLYDKVKWIGDRRWIIDGKLWSAGGVTCGIDLAAEYARQHFAPEIVQAAMDISEYKPNPAQPDPFAYLTEGLGL
ncbi:Isonitrile hydratase [Psilocybe cubensis]|uniref:DJ-1/PfpI domain-containing protein n=2 Tax=Psilocybe cubensis TaxID=181762 RepID=A0A8H7XU30_PSICU|nr:Isonitrile hydratase [Psilocybe cubensis]KAH9479869.1 Isonitrile hydratase [Psilocybe cubensis]